MRFGFIGSLLLLSVPITLALDKPLDIKIIKEPECDKKSKKGDTIEVHYRGTLEDGTEFDASYNRGQPLSFKLGAGQVVKGWDEGLLNMCVFEKRKLTIQPEWAYGDRAVGPIPAKSVLIFETELINIVSSEKDEL